ncbi:MAG: hypothetical protein HOI01_10045 [Proteobacteria bacterium]|nr:hypothetical protein [Pseudomonadota bacterium]MBT6193875.1 hypothetical protein [Pseudomonadota bacterium]
MLKRSNNKSRSLAASAYKSLQYGVVALTICMLISCTTATKKPLVEKTKTQTTELTDKKNPQEKKNKDSMTKKPTFSPPVKNAAFVEVEEISIEKDTSRKPANDRMGEKQDREQSQRARPTSQDFSERKDLATENSKPQNTNSLKASLFSPTKARRTQAKKSTGGIKVNIGPQKSHKNSMNQLLKTEKGPKEESLGAPAQEDSGMSDAQIIDSGGGSVAPEVSSGDARSNKGSTYGAPNRVAESEPESPSLLEKDDDIVARQLREAAESEKDAELSEKLWQEYKRYKSGL